MSLRIHTLGGLSATRDGVPLGGAAAQPRRLAVLALLARAGDRGVTREKVIGLLWPDADDERGRKLLTQALYALRRDLGDLGGNDPIVGTKDLRLDPAVVTSDVIEFQAAWREGALERAAALHGGRFLDGFHLASAPEFERWAARERDHLGHDYRKVLEQLARAAVERGDGAAAIGWWRRLVAQDPLNTRFTVALMRSLAEAGDVRGALRHARVYEALIEQELDLAPDAEVVALARRLREGRGAADTADTPARAAPAGHVPVGSPPAPRHPAEASAPGAPYAPPGDDPAGGTTALAKAIASEALGVASSVAATPSVGVPAPAGTVARRRWPRWAVPAAAVALAVGGAAAWWAHAADGDGEAATSAGATAAAVVAVGRVVDYRARAAGAADLGPPLADMLATNLARAPGLRVLSAARVHEVSQLREPAGESAATGLAGAARRAGATEVIEGALYRLGTGELRLDLRRVDARTGGVLAAYTVSGGDAFALADSGTARLVADHGARVPAGAIADVTTRSIAAYRLYEERVRASRRGDDATSAAFLDAAPREDPTFAMAAVYAVREPRALHALDRAAPPR